MSHNRLNPLDPGPRDTSLTDAQWRNAVALRRRVLVGSLAESALGRPLVAVEHTALDASLRYASLTQRLTTLSILFAVLRDLTGNPKLAAELAKVVVEPGEIMSGTQPKPRLTLRKRDAKFFADRVQAEGTTATLVALDGAHLGLTSMLSRTKKLSSRPEGRA